MDVRLRFKKDTVEYNERTCIIVVDIREISMGLIVDCVSEVINITEDNIAPLPQIIRDYHHRYIKGIGKAEGNIKLLLDCDRLLNEEEIKTLNNIP